MGVSVLLDELERLGVTPTVVGEKLQLRPGSRVPPNLVEALRQHKAELLDHLRRQPGSENFVPWVLEEWRRVSIPDWRRILQESLAKGDRKRAEYARWMLREVLLDPESEGTHG